ncbi:MAG: hypothetical protein IPJ86_11520 [Bacteroidetes bacterium]|nr:hypothetical protein [Bacteroidota bacterium]
MTVGKDLKLYLEKGSVRKVDRLLSLVKKNYSNRGIENNLLQAVPSIIRSNHPFTTLIQPEIYNGKNPVANKIAAQISEAKLATVCMAILHGSISSSEEISYSDFDCILLIDETKLKNIVDLRQLRKLIAETERMMFNQDALQHHGWKVFLQNDFSDYPDAQFPLELLSTGKVIYPSFSQPLKVNIINSNQNYKKGFDSVIKSIEKKCNKQPNDLFKFKIFCSEMLLLPSLFLQAKHHRTFMKKESFKFLEMHFETIDQKILNEISTFRLQWKQPSMNFSLSLFHRFRKSGIYISALAPSIPHEIKIKLTNEWYLRAFQLCQNLNRAL